MIYEQQQLHTCFSNKRLEENRKAFIWGKKIVKSLKCLDAHLSYFRFNELFFLCAILAGSFCTNN